MSCGTCARWRTSTLKKDGKLMPILVSDECWNVVSMDFKTVMRMSSNFDAIMNIVDKLLKRSRYAASTQTLVRHKLQESFYVVVRHHGLLKFIISDRNPKFTSNFWKSLMAITCTKLSTTTVHGA